MVEVVSEDDLAGTWSPSASNTPRLASLSTGLLPTCKRSIVVLQLEGETYQTYGQFGCDAVASSATLSGLTVPVGVVFAAA